ncbi:MAG: epoxyqueuosine reductase [Victivallales bacterium]|nr:epoxyqueuosine reductase [Victivallales bacterium]
MHTEIEDKLISFLEEWRSRNAMAAIGVVPLSDDTRAELAASFADNADTTPDASTPRYLCETREIRMDPLKLHPWARSIFTLAIPFESLPPHQSQLPTPRNPVFSGAIAAYATRVDYHIFAKTLLANLAEEMRTAIGREFRAEPAVDTKPLAERSLARLASLGSIGRNQALRIPGHGSGCFLCELATDLEIAPPPIPAILADSAKKHNPRTLPSAPNKKTIDSDCSDCGACLHSCPTGALSTDKNRGFRAELCRSHLTMEKRGILSQSESKLLGNWIFGCDECLKPCPDTRLPSPAQVDLEWLLESSAGEIRRTISGTAMEYAGVTLLRRNAIIALANTNDPQALNLISRFSRKTSSGLLCNQYAVGSGK